MMCGMPYSVRRMATLAPSSPARLFTRAASAAAGAASTSASTAHITPARTPIRAPAYCRGGARAPLRCRDAMRGRSRRPDRRTGVGRAGTGGAGLRRHGAARTVLTGQGVLESVIADDRGGLLYTDNSKSALMRLDRPGGTPRQVAPLPKPGGLLLEPGGTVIAGSGNGFQEGAIGNVSPMAKLLRIDPRTGPHHHDRLGAADGQRPGVRPRPHDLRLGRRRPARHRPLPQREGGDPVGGGDARPTAWRWIAPGATCTPTRPSCPRPSRAWTCATRRRSRRSPGRGPRTCRPGSTG